MKALRDHGARRSPTKARLRRSDAVLVIDVLNDLEFPGGERVLPWAERLVKPLRSLCSKARKAGIPVIYVNDNHGMWRASFEQIYQRCTRPGVRGAEVTRLLKPRRSDFVILKPRHSAFFCTPLLPLLEELGIKRLFLTGMATNLCVLATAHDAAMHRFPIVVVSDCCAAETDFDHDVVLAQLQKFFGARICKSSEARNA
jgi:nicotinamidase-related amidase